MPKESLPPVVSRQVGQLSLNVPSSLLPPHLPPHLPPLPPAMVQERRWQQGNHHILLPPAPPGKVKAWRVQVQESRLQVFQKFPSLMAPPVPFPPTQPGKVKWRAEVQVQESEEKVRCSHLHLFLEFPSLPPPVPPASPPVPPASPPTQTCRFIKSEIPLNSISRFKIPWPTRSCVLASLETWRVCRETLTRLS